MANIDKIVCAWTGFTGAPGYTALYFSAAQGPVMQPKVVTFWQSVASFLPTGVQVNVPTTGATLDETNGQQVGVWSGGAPGAVPGTGGSSYSSVSGGLIRLDTGQFRRSRKVRGRVFIVPLYASAYATNGVIVQSVANSIKAAADALNSTNGQWVVWHRPLMDYTVKPPTLKVPGEHFAITSTTVPTKVTYLSSRRD